MQEISYTQIFTEDDEPQEEAGDQLRIKLDWQPLLGAAAELTTERYSAFSETWEAAKMRLKSVAHWAEKGIWKFALQEGQAGDYVLLDAKSERLIWLKDAGKEIREELNLGDLRGQQARIWAALEWATKQANALLGTKFRFDTRAEMQAGAALYSDEQQIEGASAHLLATFAPAPSLPRICLVADAAGWILQAGVDTRQWGKTTQYKAYLRYWCLPAD